MDREERGIPVLRCAEAFLKGRAVLLGSVEVAWEINLRIICPVFMSDVTLRLVVADRQS